MNKSNDLVSVIIPTKNSAEFLENCLRSIRNQSYTSIEIIVVDGGSKDRTVEIAKKYHATIYHYQPNVQKGIFDAPHKRNYGVKKAKGIYVYYVDADMELQKSVVAEAVALCKSGYSGVIVSEDSFGEGIWARAKNLERMCYWGDDTVEAPRFFDKSIWNRVGGLDETIGGGGDDWDLLQKLKDNGYTVGWTKSKVLHNEGRLTLSKLCKKRFMYGKETVKYLTKRPRAGFVSYFPIRKAYLTHWKDFLKRPVDTGAFVIMRTAEYSAGFAGIILAGVKKR